MMAGMKSAIALLILAGFPALATAEVQSVTVAGTPRGYAVHLPNGRAPGAPAPLVLVFHGGGGNAANIARKSGMDAQADREGFIAVYPNGTGRRANQFLTWNAMMETRAT